jgi:hypothetical protein
MNGTKTIMKIKVWLKGGFGNTLFQITHALAIHYATKKDIVLVSNLTDRNLITKILKWTIHDPIYIRLIEASNIPLSIERMSTAQSIITYTKAFISRKKERKICGTLYSNCSDILNIQSGLKNHLGYFQHSDCNSYYSEAFADVINELYRQFNSKQENKVVVHFRWGDSDQAKKSLRYYEIIRSMLVGMDECLVVTDSVKVAKRFFASVKNCNVYQGDTVSDFGLLVSADVLFCAPSTFSWWAGQSSKGTKIYMPTELKTFTFINNNRFIYI